MHTLLIEEQRLQQQNEANIDMQEELSDIQTEQQIEVIKAQNAENSNDDKKKKATVRKRNVATGRGAGRPRTVGTDKWGNRNNENNWDSWNTSH